MQAAVRPYVVAGAALVAASLVVSPVPPRPGQLPVLSLETRLVDSASILNVPFNLFQDIVNIPANELGAINQFGDSLLFTGTWVTASATNLWGEDPGDPGHFMSVVDMAIPFPGITGQGLPEVDALNPVDVQEAANGTLPLSQQITLLLDAEIPVSATSAADWSDPLAPTPTITGSTGIDHALWTLAILDGQQQYPLIDNWFQVPLSDLTSGNYNFGDVADPSAGVGPDGSVPSMSFPDGNTFYGTIPTGELNANGNPIDLMPWSNLDFKMNLLEPFQSFFNSLSDPIDPSTYLNGFDIPTFTDLGQSLETFLAGSVVAFDPFVPGSPVCPGTCDVPSFMTPQGILEGMNNLSPDSSIKEWLDLFNSPSTGPYDLANPFGSANGPTQTDVNAANWFEVLSQKAYDFGVPSPADPPGAIWTPDPIAISPQMQDLIDAMQQSLIPGMDFPGTTGSSVQDFFQYLADLSGYSSADTSALFSSGDFLTELPSAASLADGLGPLLTDLGLGNLISLF
jgi:hypothetical protein